MFLVPTVIIGLLQMHYSYLLRGTKLSGRPSSHHRTFSTVSSFVPECYPNTYRRQQSRRQQRQRQQQRQQQQQNSFIVKSSRKNSNNKKKRNLTTKNPTDDKDGLSSPFRLPIEKILYDYSYGSRIVRLSSSSSSSISLPVLAEVQLQGRTEICMITRIVVPELEDGVTQEQQQQQQQPKLEIKVFETTRQNNYKESNDSEAKAHVLSASSLSIMTVDIGQITTIWDDLGETLIDEELMSNLTTNTDADTYHPAENEEMALESMYRSKVGRARGMNQNDSLKKKDIPILAAECAIATESKLDSASDWNNHGNVFYEQILRQVIKTGKDHARLVDTLSMTKNQDGDSSLVRSEIQRRIVASKTLSQDSKSGGRFKRYPCIWLGNAKRTTPSSSSIDEDDITISILNGGWLVQDQSVRASSEGRKFAALVEQNHSGVDPNNDSPPVLSSAVEERIAHRLECLAMGGRSLEEEMNTEDTSRDESGLSLDVRTALESLELPLTYQGATEALIRMGRWAEASGGGRNKRGYEPWPTTVLEAASWYVQVDRMRKGRLCNALRKGDKYEDLEGRVDLSNLPSICIDAVNTSFRDDAIGIRPRASTGRKVNPDASKWEILIHIADVSDLYAAEIECPANDEENKQEGYLATLAEAAAQRGTSRYDLPLGPLHLLPHNVLDALSLYTYKPDLTSSRVGVNPTSKESFVNRCVSVWVYIDEGSGKVIDAGIERTIISRPLALSFATASALLEQGNNSINTNKENPELTKATAILKVVDRNTNIWSKYRRSQSKDAADREDRLSAREKVGRYTKKGSSGTNKSGSRTYVRDDGHDGFQRSRGHRLVDTAMDLYSYVLKGLMYRNGRSAPLPRVAGTEQGRVATGPLRRYIDGMAQRQVLSVLCKYGGRPLTLEECKEVGRRATNALNQVSNLNESKHKGERQGSRTKQIPSNQLKAIQRLETQARDRRKQQGRLQVLKAIYTGKSSEVVLVDHFGAVATLRGVPSGTLRPGTEITATLQSIDEKSGKIIVRYDSSCSK